MVSEGQSQRLTYTIEEAARLIGIGRSSAYQAAQTGEIPTVRIGRRLLVPVQALEGLLATVGSNTSPNIQEI